MKKYTLIVHPDLFIAVKFSTHLEDTTILKYYDQLISKCINDAKPSYRKGDEVRTGSMKHQTAKADRNIWVVRGYFPGTGIFYKMKLVQTFDHSSREMSNDEYVASISMMQRSNKRTPVIRVQSAAIQEAVVEKELLGSSAFKVDYGRLQKTMSPSDIKNPTIKKRKPK